MNLLAISGSLRTSSSNTRLLSALALLVPTDVTFAFYSGLAELPHFNPDLDIDPAPVEVKKYRERLQWADAVAISSPEYAHGVPGALKNALDWVVGSGELVGKPVALLNASPRATHAYESLTETLRTMSAVILPEASITVPLLGSDLDPARIATNDEYGPALRAATEVLVFYVNHRKS